MTKQIALPPLDTDTETLLQGLILEAHAIIREEVRPALASATDPYERARAVEAAVKLVQIGATVGDTIARLRFGEATEMRQKITVERIASIPQAKGEGVRRNRETTIKLLRPDQVWQPALGAPRGNRNAGKPLSTIAAKARDLRRRAKQLDRLVRAANKKGGVVMDTAPVRGEL
jgi:hypothetical protein